MLDTLVYFLNQLIDSQTVDKYTEIHTYINLLKLDA